MMKLYIQTENGEPIDHPILEENFIQAFSNIDTKNLTPEFSKYIRQAPLTLNRYEGVTYERNGYAFTDFHRVRSINNKEKTAVIDQIKSNQPNENWILSKDGTHYAALIPISQDGNTYRWDELTLNWISI
jgi:hypothetical protein